MNFWITVLLLISMMLVIISALLSSLAAGDVTSINGYSNSTELQAARYNLNIGAFILWITFIVIFLIFGYLIYTSNRISSSPSFLSGGLFSEIFLFIIVVVLVIAGLFNSIGAADMQKSNLATAAENNFSYRNAYVSAILALGGGGLILIGIITYIIIITVLKVNPESAALMKAKELSSQIGTANLSSY